MIKYDEKLPHSQELPRDPNHAPVPEFLANLLLPIPGEDEWEGLEDELTDVDCRLLDRLASSDAFVATLGDLDENTANRQTTKMIYQETTSTQFASLANADEFSREFRRLLLQLEAYEHLDMLSWTSNYRLTKMLGRGGQGTVYLTECLNEHNLRRAMKFFSPEPYGSPEAYQEDMQRMAHVALLLARTLVDNLVIVERFSNHNGIHYMTMRWIDGLDLASLMEPGLLNQLHERMDGEHWSHLINEVNTDSGQMRLGLMPGMAVNIIEKCLRALDALHNEGIVHGDIKPSNIMLDRYGSIRLVDLGSAFETSAPPRRHTWTPLYAPPEIFRGGDWTPQSDMASLGYVLIEMLSGKPAVSVPRIGSDSTRDIGNGWSDSLLEQKKSLPDRLEQLLPANVLASKELMKTLRRLIDPDPDKRFKDAEEAMIGRDGTYPFMQSLARLKLMAPFSQKIKLWLADVDKLQREEAAL